MIIAVNISFFANKLLIILNIIYFNMLTMLKIPNILIPFLSFTFLILMQGENISTQIRIQLWFNAPTQQEKVFAIGEENHCEGSARNRMICLKDFHCSAAQREREIKVIMPLCLCIVNPALIQNYKLSVTHLDVELSLSSQCCIFSAQILIMKC